MIYTIEFVMAQTPNRMRGIMLVSNNYDWLEHTEVCLHNGLSNSNSPHSTLITANTGNPQLDALFIISRANGSIIAKEVSRREVQKLELECQHTLLGSL